MRYFNEARDMWHRLVPPSGAADTVQGELLRSVEQLREEASRNANVNWEAGDFSRYIRFVRMAILDSTAFDDEALSEIDQDLKTIENFENPFIYGDAPYDRLEDRIVEWTRAHPDPIPNKFTSR